MSKVEPLCAASVAAARRVHAERGIQHPWDLDIEALCMFYGAMVEYGLLRTAAASMVRTARVAVIRVREDERDLPRARWSAAHELGHLRLHLLADYFRLCTGVPNELRDDEVRRLEQEADHFAAELLLPELFARPWCASPRPTLDDVERLARTCRTSLQATALRFVQLSPAPCAVVFARGGIIKWSAESAAFPGHIVKGRPLHLRSRAAVLGRGRAHSDDAPREVPGRAWGARLPLSEHALAFGRDVGVLSWIVGEGGVSRVSTLS
jgi:Zn-dependent peptidase ImmA (M78 family)